MILNKGKNKSDQNQLNYKIFSEWLYIAGGRKKAKKVGKYNFI